MSIKPNRSVRLRRRLFPLESVESFYRTGLSKERSGQAYASAVLGGTLGDWVGVGASLTLR
jgi:hypothetical protein